MGAIIQYSETNAEKYAEENDINDLVIVARIYFAELLHFPSCALNVQTSICCCEIPTLTMITVKNGFVSLL